METMRNIPRLFQFIVTSPLTSTMNGMSINSNAETSGQVTEEEFCASLVNRGNEKVESRSVDSCEEAEEQEEAVSH